MKRRQFLQGTAAGAVALAARPSRSAGSTSAEPANPDGTTGSLDPRDLLRVTDPGERRGDMLYRTLGRTGEKVSIIGLGGSHIGKPPVDPQMAVRLIHAALDRGINFLDNCWDYNGGQSELRMGTALSQGGYRQKAFLMTKIDGRTRTSAMQQLEESMKRLKTDHLDLVQFHEVLRFEDPDRIFGPDGAIEALVQARKDGKVRHIGFTGHKDPRIHLYMLDVAARHGFQFDSVQMPLNVMDAHFRSFGHLVVPVAVQQHIGVLGMKTFGDSVILKSGLPVTPIDMLHFSMNLPTSVIITGIDNEKVLDQAFEAARTFRPMDADQVAAIADKTRAYAMEGKYELFKTSNYFDTTAKHPDFLGGLTPGVEDLAPGPAT
ncbi:aldo/keto reductase [Paraburkholderia sp. JPY419]|uniref:aldo/keto reductase n=1 Tax=Paraburkholderia sp. JPY419 TaxID=667660 RepID=UPI003D1E4CB3